MTKRYRSGLVGGVAESMWVDGEFFGRDVVGNDGKSIPTKWALGFLKTG